MDQWNQIENPDINPHTYKQLIVDKEAKIVQWKKKVSSTNGAGRTVLSICKRMQIDPYLCPCIKLKFKYVKNLNINPVTLNLIEESGKLP